MNGLKEISALSDFRLTDDAPEFTIKAHTGFAVAIPLNLILPLNIRPGKPGCEGSAIWQALSLVGLAYPGITSYKLLLCLDAKFKKLKKWNLERLGSVNA
jgi:hypothetical protein